MHDDPEPGEPKPVNRRNLFMVLGAVGALLIVANIGERDIGFFGSDDDHPRVAIDIDDNDADEFDAVIEKIEARIENRIEDRIEASVGSAVDDAEMDAAIEELKEGDPDRFIEATQKALGSPAAVE